MTPLGNGSCQRLHFEINPNILATVCVKTKAVTGEENDEQKQHQSTLRTENKSSEATLCVSVFSLAPLKLGLYDWLQIKCAGFQVC